MSLKDRLRESGREITLTQVADGGYHTTQWWAANMVVTIQAIRQWIDKGKFEAALCEGRIFCRPKIREKELES